MKSIMLDIKEHGTNSSVSFKIPYKIVEAYVLFQGVEDETGFEGWHTISGKDLIVLLSEMATLSGRNLPLYIPPKCLKETFPGITRNTYDVKMYVLD